MSIFREEDSTQAFLKCGLLGFTGSGKTHTGTAIAIGLHKHIKSKQPIYFLDTETGSDWVRPWVVKEGIRLVTAKTRAFTDLMAAVKEVDKAEGILLIDSITHFWRELTETYARKKNRTRGLEFQDWSYLKGSQAWGGFTDLFINSRAHIVMCGRAGYEYDYFTNDAGKRELEKTGIKMKAETETGYEPSLLILMERKHDIDTNQVWREAHVLKDRSRLLDGQSFRNPTFETFRPHIEFLNLGGAQLGVDTTRSSDDIIHSDDRDWQWRKQQKEIVLDEIQTLLVEHYPSQSAEHKQAKLKALKDTFDTGAWKAIEAMPLEVLRTGFELLYSRLEPPVATKVETKVETDLSPDVSTCYNAVSVVDELSMGELKGRKVVEVPVDMLAEYVLRYGEVLPAAERSRVSEIVFAAGESV